LNLVYFLCTDGVKKLQSETIRNMINMTVILHARLRSDNLLFLWNFIEHQLLMSTLE